MGRFRPVSKDFASLIITSAVIMFGRNSDHVRPARALAYSGKHDHQFQSNVISLLRMITAANPPFAKGWDRRKPAAR